MLGWVEMKGGRATEIGMERDDHSFSEAGRDFRLIKERRKAKITR